MNNQNAFPLSWPKTWKRTDSHLRAAAPFFVTRTTYDDAGVSRYAGRTRRSMSDAAEEVLRQLAQLGAQQVVISTNVELRNDGLPYSNRRPPEDPGAAVYFVLRKRPCVLASDKWKRVEDNLWAIAKHIEALRGQERWGVGSVEQAFAGYTALPAPGDSTAATWYNVLGVSADCSYDDALAAYRAEAMKTHPDKPGGSHESMSRLNASWDQARQHFGR